MKNYLQKLLNCAKNLSLSLSLFSLKNTVMAVLFIFGVSLIHAQNVVDFEELSLESESHWNGADFSGIFTSKYLSLYNEFTDWGGGMSSWLGFAYTNETDVSTMSYLNEFSAASGSGVFGSENYAVAYIQGDWMNNYEPIPISVKIDRSEISGNIPGMFISLNAYSSLYMADNDFYQTEKHWLSMHIIAINSELDYEISKDIILADYRFEETDGYKMDDWTYISMEWAGTADSLVFIMRTSDTGDWGPNTPTYFCLDNFGDNCPDGVPQMEAEIKNQYIINSGESVQLSALAKGGVQPYTIMWSDIIGLDDYQTQTPIASPSQSTTWSVTITDAIGAQVVEDVTVNVGTTDIKMSEISTAKAFFNSHGNIIIESETKIGQIKIYDITGKLILNQETEENISEISFSEYAKGIYIIGFPERQQTIKIVK